MIKGFLKGHRVRLIGYATVGLLLAMLATFVPSVQVSITSEGMLSVGIAPNNTQYAVGADITDIKAYAQLEPSGCCVYKGNIQLRFDLFLEPDAPGYDIHHIQVPDVNSEEFKAGYQGKVDEFGQPLDWDDYNAWRDSLPKVWQLNPFLSVFIFVDATTSDAEIVEREDLIIEQAYRYWVANGFNLRGVGSVLPISGVSTEGLSLEANQITRIGNLVSDQYMFARDGSAQIVLNVGGAGVASANPDPITIGADATTRATSAGATSRIAKDNPANDNGSITSVEFYAYFADLTDVEVATFEEVSTDHFTSRDSEAIGTVVHGSKQTKSGLDMTVVTGDYIGSYNSGGYYYQDDTGFAGIWELGGDQIPASNVEFTFFSGKAFSLYGEGETAGCSESIENLPASWTVNAGDPVLPNSDYSTGLTFFTVENLSGGAVDITISGTDMTGGGYTWDLADDGSPGDMTYALKAGLDGGDYTIIVRETATYNTLVSSLADSGTQDWGLKMWTPTTFDNEGNEKSGTITLTAVCN